MTIHECQQIAQPWFDRYGICGSVIEANFIHRFGSCRFVNRNPKIVHIRMHREYMLHAPRVSVIETLLHEIAHAITGPMHYHDEAWKRNAILVGCKPRACGTKDESELLDRINAPRAKLTVSCCGKDYRYYRSPKRGVKYSCPRCDKPVTFVSTAKQAIDDSLTAIFTKGK